MVSRLRGGLTPASGLSVAARAGRVGAGRVLAPVIQAGRAGARAADAAVRAGETAVRGLMSVTWPAPAWGMTAALSLPARPVGFAASTARAAASAAASAAARGGGTVTRIGASAVAIADVGPARRRRRVWSRAGRAHVEVRGLTGRGPAHRRLAGAVTSALTRLKGVRWAEVNAVTADVFVDFDEEEADIGDLVKAVEAAEKAHGTDADDFLWSPPHPADEGPIASAASALAADVLGIVSALTGRLARLGTPPRALRAPVALIEAQPRLRQALAQRLGPVGTDLALAVANAVAHGLTEGEGPLAVDAAHRLLAISELRAQLGAWERRELELHSTGRPLPAECHERVPRPAPRPAGPVEKTADKTTVASLLGAGGVLSWTRDPGRAADVILATVPKAARLGREGFACMLGRELAARGVVALDGTALRRLDRVTAVVIDSGVLCSPRVQVLSAASTARRFSDAEVWQLAELVLRGRRAGDLRGTGPWTHGAWRLRRTSGSPPAPSSGHLAACGPAALALDLVDERGRRCGRVGAGLELCPLADAVLGAAREVGGRVLLTEHASLGEVASWADDVLPGSIPLAEHVRRLQAQGNGVLAVSASDDEALDASDVGVALTLDSHGVCWSADLILGPNLGELWRVLRAVAVARRVSERSARLSVGGSALGGLLISVGTGPLRGRGGLTPVHSAALAALVSGAVTAHNVSRLPEPEPARRGAWHAMSPQHALERLASPQRPDENVGRDGSGSGGGAGAGAGVAPRAAGRVISSAAVASLRGALEFTAFVRAELRDPLTPVLALGAIASAVVGSGVDALLVSSVMAGNALISGTERMRAEHALQRLLLGEQTQARRVRWAPQAAGDGPFAGIAGAPVEFVRATDLVVGDIIALRSSDVVPADARLLIADDLEVDESTLTGESMPVTKSPDAAPGAALAERTCMLYEGTSVLAGTAYAVVTATGSGTEAGRAASIAGRAGAPAGMQARLAEVTRIALPATGLGGLAVTGLGLLRGLPLRAATTSGIAVAVAAVPEGLPLVATVSELAAARRLSRHGVLVRTARALEALGRVDTVCFDKTGTLTQGQFAVARLAIPGRDLPMDSPLGRHLLRTAARACPQAAGNGLIPLAHATDRAVVAATRTYVGHDEAWQLVDQLPFETGRGYSASIGEEGGQLVISVKGAPEVVLARCTGIHPALAGLAAGGMRGPGTEGPPGAALPLTRAGRRRARAVVDALGAEGLRVLAVAEAVRSSDPGGYRRSTGSVADVADGLILIGFLGIADPPKPSAGPTVTMLSSLGVRSIMITGDHLATAATVARQVGIDAGQVLVGGELNNLPEEQRTARIAASTVIARVSPEHKVQIVASLQRAGHVVAMTGDGTNDAAAIRLADVGIGVAAHGSTSARSSADLVLTDSDNTRIADALLEGRALWAGVRDAVSILVGGNAGEVAFTILGTAASGRAPLNTRQLLLVNMLTDMLPALAVALAPARHGAKGDPLTPAGGPVRAFLGSELAYDIAVRGGATALGAMGAWQVGRITGRRKRADTMGLAAVVLTELGQTLLANWRSPLVIATSAASTLTLAGIVETPGVSQFFGCTPLGPVAWAIVAASATGGTLAAAIVPRFLRTFDTVSEDRAVKRPSA